MSEFCSEFRFRYLEKELIDKICPNFVNALICTRSILGLIPIIFQSYGP